MTNINDLPHAMRELQRLESELAAKERAAQQAEHQAAENASLNTEATGEAKAREMLAATFPLYAKRAQAARELAHYLAAFWDVENDILKIEGAAFQVLAQTNVFADTSPARRMEKARRDIGLPADRIETGMPEPTTPGETLAATVIVAVTSGNLVPSGIGTGEIRLPGGRGQTWDFRRKR